MIDHGVQTPVPYPKCHQRALDAEEQHLSDLEFTNISGNATRAVNGISIINSKAGFDLSTVPY